MRRNLGSRIGAAVAALVLFAMSGMAGIEIHPITHAGPGLTSVGPSSAPPVPLAQAPSNAGHAAPLAEHAAHAHHGGQPAAEPEQGETPAVASNPSSHDHHASGEDCTCVGECHSGASPTPPTVVTYAALSGEVVRARVRMRAPVVIFEDPSSYLRPLPNAPPIHA